VWPVCPFVYLHALCTTVPPKCRPTLRASIMRLVDTNLPVFSPEATGRRMSESRAYYGAGLQFAPENTAHARELFFCHKRR
jgi:hypothetical protein